MILGNLVVQPTRSTKPSRVVLYKSNENEDRHQPEVSAPRPPQCRDPEGESIGTGVDCGHTRDEGSMRLAENVGDGICGSSACGSSATGHKKAMEPGENPMTTKENGKTTHETATHIPGVIPNPLVERVP